MTQRHEHSLGSILGAMGKPRFGVSADLAQPFGMNIYAYDENPPVNLAQWERKALEQNRRNAEIAKERLRTGLGLGQPYPSESLIPRRTDFLRDTAYILGGRDLIVSPQSLLKITGITA